MPKCFPVLNIGARPRFQKRIERWIPALLLPSWLSSHKSLNLSDPQLPHVYSLVGTLRTVAIFIMLSFVYKLKCIGTRYFFYLEQGILGPHERAPFPQELRASPLPFQPHRGEGSRTELAAGKEISWYLTMHNCAFDCFPFFLLKVQD